jgi:hypothetical protein
MKTTPAITIRQSSLPCDSSLCCKMHQSKHLQKPLSSQEEFLDHCLRRFPPGPSLLVGSLNCEASKLAGVLANPEGGDLPEQQGCLAKDLVVEEQRCLLCVHCLLTRHVLDLATLLHSLQRPNTAMAPVQQACLNP